jgi:hypothetical protein
VNDGNERLGDRDELDGPKLDWLIEQALGSYTAREPRAGLEQRVLSRIAAAEAERSRHGWSWKPAWALAAAVALLAVVVTPVWFRSVRPETAVVHTPAVAEVQHSLPAAPLTARTARTTRHTFNPPFIAPLTPRSRVAGAAPEALEVASNAGPGPMERAMVAPADDKSLAEESTTLKPATLKLIELKPITIDPIQIRALN